MTMAERDDAAISSDRCLIATDRWPSIPHRERRFALDTHKAATATVGGAEETDAVLAGPVANGCRRHCRICWSAHRIAA